MNHYRAATLKTETETENREAVHAADQAEKVMRTRDYVSDSMIQVSTNALSILTGQLTYFYTNKVGMAAAMAGTILLVSRITDAISDIVMGAIVDRTPKGKEKARPWLLRMLIPFTLSIILLFTVPKAADSVMLGYGILTNIFACAVCYTAIYVPYMVLMTLETKNAEERGRLGIFRQVFSYAIGYAITITIIPVTNRLGGDQRAWIVYAVVIAVIAAAGLIIGYRGTKERYSDDQADDGSKEEKVSTWKSLKILFHNRNWVIISLTLLVMQILYAMVNIAPVYYCQYVLGNENLYSVLNMINLGACFVGFATSPALFAKFGMVRSCCISCAVGIAGCLIRGIAPASFPAAIVGGALCLYGTVPAISALPVLVCNSAEYNKYRYGVAVTGMTSSTTSFCTKVSGGLGAAAVSWILAWGGFDAALAVQSEKVIRCIYALNIWIPAGCFAIMLVLMLGCNLDKIYDRLVAENRRKSCSGKADGV